ncbi:hypothetical protein AMECASPLE_039823 [Ameca splendens]|uniref:Uncharacterized protein n=1 Tax=Ameca splendens TaxID=208324 RepID=A0ABV0XLM0_9TELE
MLSVEFHEQKSLQLCGGTTQPSFAFSVDPGFMPTSATFCFVLQGRLTCVVSSCPLSLIKGHISYNQNPSSKLERGYFSGNTICLYTLIKCQQGFCSKCYS